MQEEISRLMMEIQRSKFTERRTEPRQAFVRAVEIHTAQGQVIKAFSKDLSAQGIGVVSELEFPPNTLATLVIHSIQGEPVRLRAEARWCDGHGKGWFLVGWKFLGLGTIG
jgi:PilZ domain